MPESVIEAENIGVDRNGERLIHDLSLSIAADERLLIQGPSGAGKTTLFDVIGLLEVPTRGTLRVRRTDVTTLSESERARIRRETIGFVFQEFQLIPDLTARENALVPQTHAGQRDEAWLETLFDRLGLAENADQYPATLSGGEKQRVGIARALANRPDVVLADEPTGQLDPETAATVRDLLFELQEDTGTALVVVSHDPAVAADFDVVYHLVDGTLTSP